MRHFPEHWRKAACLLAALILAAVVGCRRDAVPPPAFCPPPASVVLDAGTVSGIPLWLPVAGRVVILDPGHGGKDDGASHNGLVEKDVNLDLALRAAKMLRDRNVTVRLTREDDVFIPLGDRSAFANSHPNAVLVSIHINAVDKNPDAHGVETFVLSGKLTDEERGTLAGEKFRMDGMDSEYGRQALASLTTRSKARGEVLAGALQRSLVARLAERDRGVKKANLAVLRETYLCPAALVEVGFVSNPRTAERMKTEDWRRRTAEAVAEGIVEFLRQPEQ